MKRIIYLLVVLLIVSCSPEEDPKPSVSTQSYTAEIGDLITLRGNNLGGIQSINIFSKKHSVAGAVIFEESRGTYQNYSFINQTETEIQFILPELYADSYVIKVGDQEIPLNVKGFIPINNVLDFQRAKLSGVKIIDENKALGALDSNLYLLNNGYLDKKFISDGVVFFGVLENGDSWYTKTIDYELYEIYYNLAGTTSYNLLTTFKNRQLDPVGVYRPHDILVTPEKQIFISHPEGIFVLENNVIKKAVDIFPGLDAYSPDEREIFTFQLTPAGTIYAQLNRGHGYVSLNPKDYTFAFSRKFSSDVTGPVFRGNTGYLILPWENLFYKSTDSGITWSESPTPTPTHGEIWNAKMNIMDANTVLFFVHSYAGSLPYTIAYITRDGGNSWQERKRFDAPTQIERYVRSSDLIEHGGLIFFTTNVFSQLWKYVQ